MKLLYSCFILALLPRLALTHPISVPANAIVVSSEFTPDSVGARGEPFESFDKRAIKAASTKTAAAAKAASTTKAAAAKAASTTKAAAKAASTTKAAAAKAASTTKASAQSVQSAVSGFASDANTVSSSLNSLLTTTDTATIKSLATTAFARESNENSQRAVLAAAAGTTATAANALIVKNTPIVLKGLQAIIDSPTAATAKSNVATIAKARNPNILPSITTLSNAALKAVGLTQNAQTFTATNV
ncbi:hypothetical protein BP5796_05018 [Coleophoma crateriformis]|uniref:Uncharacterized protein n=1 Tax=Coleophoma crateriformis TaxID=565419 RepID=A0A3D8SAY4_9HELO|nr:hypothetical protein BP5796_05018 [Coleophoma crateriformis]